MEEDIVNKEEVFVQLPRSYILKESKIKCTCFGGIKPSSSASSDYRKLQRKVLHNYSERQTMYLICFKCSLNPIVKDLLVCPM